MLLQQIVVREREQQQPEIEMNMTYLLLIKGAASHEVIAQQESGLSKNSQGKGYQGAYRLSLLVTTDNLFPQLGAVHSRSQSGAHQESTRQFAVQTVRFVRWRCQTVLEHHWDQSAHGIGDCLVCKRVWLFSGEGAYEALV